MNPHEKATQAGIETEKVKAGQLKVGDIFFFMGEEFEVTRWDFKKDWFMKVKDINGKERDWNADVDVEKAVVESIN